MRDLTHIERSSLPWRPERATECGLDATRHPTWTRREATEKQKEMGRQRFSLFCCMTCLSTMERHSTWEEDPASCLVRHAAPMQRTRHHRRGTLDEKRRFADELRAIAALVAEHREEFDRLVREYGEVVDMTAIRRRTGAP